MLETIINSILYCILAYYFLLSIWYVYLLVTSFTETFNQYKENNMGNISHLVNQNVTTPITVVVPMFNEETRVLNTVYSLLNSTYKHLTIILVNDGSTDNTLDLLKERFELFKIPKAIKKDIETQPIKDCYRSKLHDNILLLDKAHGPFHNGADCLNAALNICKTPLMMSVDADTVVSPESISNMVYTFLSNSHCVAVSGSIFMSVGCKIKEGQIIKTGMPNQNIAATQAVEHLRSFSYGRAGLNYLTGPCSIPGAFCLYEVELLREVGGFDTPNFAYDLEIAFRFHHYTKEHGYPCKLKHSTNTISLSELPTTLMGYGHQRSHWMRGMMRSIFNHGKLIFIPKYGVVSMLIFPCFIAFDIFAPVLEFITYITVLLALILGIFNYSAFLLFILLAWSYVLMLTAGMFFLNKITLNLYPRFSDSVKVLWFTTTEMLFMRPYRGLSNFVGVLLYFFNRIKGNPL